MDINSYLTPEEQKRFNELEPLSEEQQKRIDEIAFCLIELTKNE